MAREYNAKYNRATLFCYNRDEEIKLKVKTDFEKFSHLFYMLKLAFKQSTYKFTKVFIKYENWQKEVAELFCIDIIDCDKNVPKYITHKLCALELMEVMTSFAKTFGVFARQSDCEAEDKEQSLLDKENFEIESDKNFIKKSCGLYINAIELIKDFYSNI